MITVRFLRLAIGLSMSVALLACCLVTPIFVSPGFFNDQPRDRMPGLWMMRRWRNQMPGPGMMYEWIPLPDVTAAPTVTPGGDTSVSYMQDVQPIFERECAGCHGGQGGLYLDSYDSLMIGGASGAVVIPGDPDASELVSRVKGISQPRMPLGEASLTALEIEVIVAWITKGCLNN